MRGMRIGSVLLALAGGTHAGMAGAQQTEPAAAGEVFTLGQVTVTEVRPSGGLDDTLIDAAELRRFGVRTLDDAVRLVPGVMSSVDGGRRNERDIFVRGFGRLQVPLSIDGVRIYLPADNRLDFRRFLTSDLAQVQISKGYVSVIDGPGALGGAINLVTRKPVEPFEARFELGREFGADGAGQAWDGYASAGMRRDRFYAQASVSAQNRDGWRLPDGFDPTTIEDGGERDRSSSRDSRVNLKLGLVPNDADEYSLSYTRQRGRKGAPLNVHNDPPVPGNSYWDWPWWNIGNLYFLSHTRLGAAASLKTRLFYNEFDNGLDAYDDVSYTTQSKIGRFRSIYFDRGYGGSAELALRALPASDTRLAVHWREDKHAEYSINRPTHPQARSTDPVTRTRETTWSLALENLWHASETLDLLAGLSYDRNRIELAEDFAPATGIFEYPAGGSHATNGQAQLRWRPAVGGQWRASVSSRTRFPTLFERFSTRFGTALPNPDLGTERATQYELSWQREVPGTGRITASLFRADLSDAIQTVVVATEPDELTQTRNVGDGRQYGLELGGEARVGDTLAFGGNFTWMHRQIHDALQPGVRAIGTPDLQGLVYLSWTPTQGWEVTPDVEFASDRWSDERGGGYTRTGDYTVLNLQLRWAWSDRAAISLGGRNLLDQDYAFAWGFPEPGRTLYARFQWEL